MKGEALFGVPCGRGKAAWGDGDAESTRAHTLSFFPSLGRSMIEMLGVLAIIGVLSAGGIMGYTVAMESYKVNKYIEIVQQTVANAATLILKKQVRTSSAEKFIVAPALCSVKIIPDEICNATEDPTSQYRRGLWGEQWQIYESEYNTTTAIIFAWHSAIPVSACVKVLTNKSWEGMVYKSFKPMIHINRGDRLYLPASIDDAKTFCKNTMENDFKPSWLHVYFGS